MSTPASPASPASPTSPVSPVSPSGAAGVGRGPGAAGGHRRAPSWTSAIEAGVTVWYPLLGGIAAWTVHLVALASLVQYTCNAPGSTWLLHAITVGCVAMTVLAGWLSWRLARADGDDSGAADGSRRVFIGRLGLLLSAINLALILLEEVYVVALHTTSCA